MSEITGIVLCGGKGSRLNELGKIIPKTLLQVNDKPMLDYSMEKFIAANIKDLRIAIGHLGEQIIEHVEAVFGDKQIKFIDDGPDASMLKRLESSIPHSKGESIVIYGDTFIDLDLQDLVRFHRKEGRKITIVTGRGRSPWGVIHTDESKVVEFDEKPEFTYYIGGFICDNSILDDIQFGQSEKQDSLGFVELLNSLIANNQVTSFLHEGFTTTFNTVIELKESDSELKKYMTLGTE